MKNVNKKRKEKKLELFPQNRQLFPLDECTFLSLSLSLSLSLTHTHTHTHTHTVFRGEARLIHILNNVKYSIIWHSFLFLVPLSHFFLCHYDTGCLIFRGKHFRAGITVLMTSSSLFICHCPFSFQIFNDWSFINCILLMHTCKQIGK